MDAVTDGDELIVVKPDGQNVAVRYLLSDKAKLAIERFDGGSLDDLLGRQWLEAPAPPEGET